MKRIAFFLILGWLMLSFMPEKEVTLTQTSSGIQFQKLTFAQAKKLAKETGKIIFIDANASWCGPCKRMAATSFKDESVATLYNEKFINLNIDCEKHADGPEIARLYRVAAYPTLLFIDGNGKKVKEAIGFQTADQLKALGNKVN